MHTVTQNKRCLVFNWYLFLAKNFQLSHIPQRKEKDCLNCGTVVQGRYCHVCGQENVVPKESFWHMTTHFVYDITHFDSKFFETMKDLLFRPGFLSKEYMMGRRARYLHPIKMYVFTSAVFFLLFFSVFKIGPNINDSPDRLLTTEDRLEDLQDVEEELAKDTANTFLKETAALLADTSRPLTVKAMNEFYQRHYKGVNMGGKVYTTIGEYDSIQAQLPSAEKDGWFKRRMIKKIIYIKVKYGDNPAEGFRRLSDSVMHRLPYMLFVSLPLFAFLLKMVYFRRKQFYYADHGVFTIHLYIFSFILLLLVFSLSKLEDWLHTGFIDYLVFFLFVGLQVYLYKAMRKFYGQGRGKTFTKYLLVAFSSLLMMVFLFVVFAFFSAYNL